MPVLATKGGHSNFWWYKITLRVYVGASQIWWRMAYSRSWRLFVLSTNYSRNSVLFIFWLLLLMRVGADEPPTQSLLDLIVLIDIKNSYGPGAPDVYGGGPEDNPIKSPLEGDSSSFEPGGFWSSWKATDENTCAWMGVTCTTNFTVGKLDLSGWTLSRSLDFYAFNFLRDLRELDVSSCNLARNGFLWEDVPYLPSGLTRLDLSNNNINSEVPDLSYLENLRVLALGGNNLWGPFPRELGILKSLVSLDLSGNQLNGTIPSLSNQTNLLYLYLDNNRFSSFEDPEFPLPTSLRHLSIRGNQLEGQLPHGLTKMANLEVLYLSNNRLRGKIPSGLALQLNHSFWLDLSQNFFSGQIPMELLQPSPPGQAASLNLSHNNLSGSIPIPLDGGEGRLYYYILDFSHNELSGPIPFIFNHENTTINSLRLHNNHLSGDIVDVLLDGYFYPGLYQPNYYHYTSDLRLQNNLFTGDLSRIVKLWQNFSLIQVLDLSNNNLQMSSTEAVPDPLRSMFEAFSYMQYLTDIRIGGNNFTGTSLPRGYSVPDENGYGYPLTIYRTLKVLDLSSSHVQGEISDAVFNNSWFQGLQVLNLHNNEVTGPLSPGIFKLPQLSVLNVSNNHLSGPLPYISPGSSLYNPSLFSGNALCGDPLPSCFQARNVMHWWMYLIIVCSVTIAVGSSLVVAWQWRVYHKRHQQDADLINVLMEREMATLMSLQELKKATNNFCESAQIGEGGFGTVYLGILNDGSKVAIKRSKHEGSKKDKEKFLNEVRILSQVNHSNLVKLLGCCMVKDIALLVFEFVSNGTLQQHLRGKVDDRKTCLNWKQRLNIAIQIAEGLNYLHSATTFPIYHRDVKSSNILLTDDLDAKVVDFGVSRLAPIEATHVSTVGIQGTIGYIDPEYYTTNQLTSKSDVYSFGVVLLELISARPAMDLSREEDKFTLVDFAKPIIENGNLQELIDPTLMETYNDPAMRESIWKVVQLAMECLNVRSKARPSMQKVSIELHSNYNKIL